MEIIQRIPLNGKLTTIERSRAIQLAQPIVEYGLPRAADNARIQINDMLEAMFSVGRWAYAGASVVIDLLETMNGVERRPASYAFFEKKVICVDDYLHEPISSTPAHEVGEEELLRLMVTLGIQGEE